MRLVFAGGAALFCTVAAIEFAAHRWPGMALACAGVAVVALVNCVVVGWRIRQGPHFQPGRSIPAYRPIEVHDAAGYGSAPARDPPTERQRVRRYLALMGTCLALIALAWTVVRAVSVTAAEIMSVVAMLIPPSRPWWPTRAGTRTVPTRPRPPPVQRRPPGGRRVPNGEAGASRARC
jgi:hypothetical protein